MRPVTVEFVDSPHNSPEERRHPREPVTCLVIWDHRRREGEEGEILDISPSGLFLSAEWGVPDYLSVGDVVWGRFDVGPHDHVFSATVRWSGFSPLHQRYGLGLEFNDVSQIPIDALTEFVRRHSVVPSRAPSAAPSRAPSRAPARLSTRPPRG